MSIAKRGPTESFASFEGGVWKMIDEVKTASDASAVVKKLEDGKKLLEALGIFEENATRFAILEYETYMKIAKESLYSDLNYHRKKVAMFCASLSADEQEKVRSRVENGERIVTIVNNMVKSRCRKNAEKRVDNAVSGLIELYESGETVNINCSGAKGSDMDKVRERFERYVLHSDGVSFGNGLFKKSPDIRYVKSVIDTFHPEDPEKPTIEETPINLCKEFFFGNQRVRSRARFIVNLIFNTDYLDYWAPAEYVSAIEEKLSEIAEFDRKWKERHG